MGELKLTAAPGAAGAGPRLCRRTVPAWHRRARRDRQQARLLVGVTRAVDCLARHHAQPRRHADAHSAQIAAAAGPASAATAAPKTPLRRKTRIGRTSSTKPLRRALLGAGRRPPRNTGKSFPARPRGRASTTKSCRRAVWKTRRARRRRPPWHRAAPPTSSLRHKLLSLHKKHRPPCTSTSTCTTSRCHKRRSLLLNQLSGCQEASRVSNPGPDLRNSVRPARCPAHERRSSWKRRRLPAWRPLRPPPRLLLRRRPCLQLSPALRRDPAGACGNRASALARAAVPAATERQRTARGLASAGHRAKQGGTTAPSRGPTGHRRPGLRHELLYLASKPAGHPWRCLTANGEVVTCRARDLIAVHEDDRNQQDHRFLQHRGTIGES